MLRFAEDELSMSPATPNGALMPEARRRAVDEAPAAKSTHSRRCCRRSTGPVRGAPASVARFCFIVADVENPVP
jgi:hypothetical protein